MQPFLGGGEASNSISGKLKLGDETLATLDGHWDGEIYIKERGSQVCTCVIIATVIFFAGGNFAKCLFARHCSRI